MPELPEVEHAMRRLRRAAKGRTIAAAKALHPAQRRLLPPRALRSLVDRDVVRVERRAKIQLMHLDDGRVVAAHFRMNGDWHIGPADRELPPYTRAWIAFTNGTRVSLVDSRALCTLRVHANREDALPDLGPDATSDGFDATALLEALASRRAAIKPALLDQRVVAGLGNIYAAEALWIAKVSPFTPGREIDLTTARRIVRAVRLTMKRAIGAPGRVTRSESAERIAVYDREGEPCRKCRTTVERAVQAGRSTFYCPACQA